MITYEVALTGMRVQPFAEERMEEVFLSQGVDPERIVTEKVAGRRMKLSVYCPRRSEAAALAKRITGCVPRGMRVVVRRHRENDWRMKWKRYIRPFSLRTLHVVPYGTRPPRCWRGKESIVIDASIAFGTGAHPTTRLVADMVERQRGHYASFLDIGTGSGILAVVAARCGATCVWGIDIDQDAIDTARRNAALNRIYFTVLKKADIRSFPCRRHFDFVAANLLPDDLVAIRTKLLSLVSLGGYLSVSGIPVSELRRFRNRFDTKQLRCIRVARAKNWVAITYRMR